MALVAKELYRGTPATGAAALVYTVGAGKTDVIKSIHVANTTAVAATIRITIGGVVWCFDTVVPANGVLDWDDLHHELDATLTILAGQGTAASLTLAIGGLEYP